MGVLFFVGHSSGHRWKKEFISPRNSPPFPKIMPALGFRGLGFTCNRICSMVDFSWRMIKGGRQALATEGPEAKPIDY